MAAFAPGAVHVAAGPGEAVFHHLFRHPPVAAVEVVISSAALQENAKGVGGQSSGLTLARDIQVIRLKMPEGQRPQADIRRDA